MRNTQRDAAFAVLLIILFLIFLGACANIGNPEGGPFDMQPPRLIKSNPPERTINYKKKKIVLTFDENISLKDQQENLIISPPQFKQPKITAVGKHIEITLEDTLKLETTYSFNFNDGIVDYTEGNPLEGFSFAFSTGDVLDSMQISGVLLDARTLEPIQGKLVGAYFCPADSAFFKEPFKYATRTNKEGKFRLLNLKDSSYTVYGLADDDNNFYFSQPQELVAFDNHCYKTTCVDTSRVDTIKIDSLNALRDTIKRDSFVHVDYTRFMPDTIMLRMYKEFVHRPGLLKNTRADSNRLTLSFNTVLKDMPVLKNMSGEDMKKSEIFISRNPEHEKDIDYWLLEPRLIHSDSLSFMIDYEKTDSAGMAYTKRDTLTYIVSKSKKKAKEKKNKEESKDSVNLVGVKVSGTQGLFSGTPNDSVLLAFDTPIKTVNRDSIFLTDKNDSLAQPVPYRLLPLENIYSRYKLVAEWQYDKTYQLRLGRGAFVDIYGTLSSEAQYDLQISPEKDLSVLELSLVGKNLENAIVELLNKNDEVIATLTPGIYEVTAKDSTSVKDSLHAEKEPVKTPPVLKDEEKSDVSRNSDSVTGQIEEPVTEPVTDTLESKKEDSPKKAFMVKIKDVKPGDYYARLYIDENKNGVWDTGDIRKGRQPEPVYYCPLTIALKKGFTTGEKWEVFALPLSRQKPTDIRKIKPEEKKARVDKNIEYYDRIKNKKANRPLDDRKQNNKGAGGSFGGGFSGGGGFEREGSRF